MKNIKIILKTVWKYRYTIIFTLLLFFTANVLARRFHNFHLLQVFSILMLLIPLSKIKNRGVKVGITLFLSLVIGLDVYFAFVFQEKMSIGIIASIMETNSAEVYSMSKSLFLGAFLLFGVFFTLILFVEKELEKLNVSWKICLSLFFVCWFVLFPFIILNKVGDRVEDSKKMMLAYAETERRFPLVLPTIFAVLGYQEGAKSIKEYGVTKRSLPEGIVFEEAKIALEKVFLVIGESARRDHMSSYGYDIKTTPFLDSLRVDSLVDIEFYKGISCASNTSSALRLICSFATPLDDSPFVKNKNIVELAQDAGYEVLWISNQNQIGINESAVQVISAKADFKTYSRTYFNDDLSLIPTLSEKLESGKKQFCVIHLLGSHMSYHERFDTLDEEAIIGNGNEVDYDRTIHHTDRVLAAIYNEANKHASSYALCYLSDHGEIIGQGHGFMQGGVAQYEIPFLGVAKNYEGLSSIFKKYVDGDSGYLNNMNVMNIISELFGYNIADTVVECNADAGRFVLLPDGTASLFQDIKNK